MRPAISLRASAWIPPRIHPFGLDVGSFIPEGFPAYLRLLHPLYRTLANGDAIRVCWKNIAAAHNRSLNDEVVSVDQNGEPQKYDPFDQVLWDVCTPAGSLPLRTLKHLVELLRTETESPQRCSFAVWMGWGGLQELWLEAPVLHLPKRELLLCEGPISDATINFYSDLGHQSPNLWWPEDRAWCVSTEVDFHWTYLGVSSECLARLLKDPFFEASPVALTAKR